MSMYKNGLLTEEESLIAGLKCTCVSGINEGCGSPRSCLV
jgi:tetrahydromethanopterin S-methyltransferase subunit F